MSLSAALGEGLMVTVVGLCIVFSVLVILMLVLVLMRKIFYKEPVQQTKAEPAPAAPAPVKEAAVQQDEEELIAVLTAAVAASLNTSTYHLQIKSYRRIDDKTPAWNKAGLRETINSRF